MFVSNADAEKFESLWKRVIEPRVDARDDEVQRAELVDQIPTLKFEPLEHFVRKIKRHVKIIKGQVYVNGKLISEVREFYDRNYTIGIDLLQVIDRDLFKRQKTPYELLALGFFLPKNNKPLLLLKSFISEFYTYAQHKLQAPTNVLTLTSPEEFKKEFLNHPKFSDYCKKLKASKNFSTDDQLIHHLRGFGQKFNKPIEATLAVQNIKIVLSDDKTFEEAGAIDEYIHTSDAKNNTIVQYKLLNATTVLISRRKNLFLEAFFDVIFLETKGEQRKRKSSNGKIKVVMEKEITVEKNNTTVLTERLKYWTIVLVVAFFIFLIPLLLFFCCYPRPN